MIFTNYQSSDTNFNEFIQDHLQIILVTDKQEQSQKELITEDNPEYTHEDI